MIRQVVIYLTRRCNLRCEYCYIPNTPSKELTAEEICKIIDFTDKHIKPEMIIFFGGEPLIRNDIEDIINCANQTGTHYTVITNGTIKKYDVIKKMKSLTLSIDFLPWQVSAEITKKIPEIVKKSKAAFELLNEVLKYDLPEIMVSTIVTKYNVSYLPEIVEWMSQKGVWVIPGIVHTVRNNNFTFRGEIDLNLNKQQAIWMADKMIEMKKAGYLIHNVEEYFKNLPTYFDFSWKCNILDYLIINSDGHLLACHDWPGSRFPKINFLQIINRDNFNYRELQRIYSEDVKGCPGCYYNHKIQLLYSTPKDNVLIHTKGGK